MYLFLSVHVCISFNVSVSVCACVYIFLCICFSLCHLSDVTNYNLVFLVRFDLFFVFCVSVSFFCRMA